jgi:hypothetical protein
MIAGRPSAICEVLNFHWIGCQISKFIFWNVQLLDPKGHLIFEDSAEFREDDLYSSGVVLIKPT